MSEGAMLKGWGAQVMVSSFGVWSEEGVQEGGDRPNS